MPQAVLHAAVDHDCKGAPLSLSGRGIGDGCAGVLGFLHRLLDVFDREVGSHDRLFMRRQWLPDAHESSVRSSRHTRLSEIGVWGAERQTVHTLVERSQGVYVVAHDLQVVNSHLEIHLVLTLRLVHIEVMPGDDLARVVSAQFFDQHVFRIWSADASWVRPVIENQ